MIIEAYTNNGTRVRVGDEIEYSSSNGVAYVSYISLTNSNKIEHIETINVSNEYGMVVDLYDNKAIDKLTSTGKNCKKVYDMMKEIGPN